MSMLCISGGSASEPSYFDGFLGVLPFSSFPVVPGGVALTPGLFDYFTAFTTPPG